MKAKEFKAQIKLIPTGFDTEPIILKKFKTTKSVYATLYTAGNIISKFYSSGTLPSDQELQTDITEILKVYELISYNEGLPTTDVEYEQDDDYYEGIENLRRFRFHKRIERNNTLSKKVKEKQGYKCKACEFNFIKGYGVLGEKFIEAHHLVPVSSLTGDKVKLNVMDDFTVLCSNCHSMIHRQDDPSDLEALKKVITF
ncbi:MAG: putative restriction endonuclease [Mucilaginibacter sp.]|nr:putative restriction endonuclease [Mucilaginibacter sp.]